VNLWEMSLFGKRPFYEAMLWYLRNSPVDSFKEYLRHGAAGHTRSPVRFTNRDGIVFDLDMSSFIERFIYCFHYFEPGDVAAVRRLLRPGDVVMDVGANVGQYALMAAKVVGSNGVGYAFEPSPNILLKLRRNWKLNEFENLHVVPVALGSSPGIYDFYPAEGYNQGIGSFVYKGANDADGLPAKPIQAKVITLDAFCAEHAIDHVDFIKIDTEGYDLEVLKGAVQTLESNQDIVVMVEMVEKHMDANELSERIHSFMVSHKFGAFQSTNRSAFKSHVSGHLIPVDIRKHTDPVNVFYIRERSLIIGRKIYL